MIRPAGWLGRNVRKAKRDKQGELYAKVRYTEVRAFIVPQFGMVKRFGNCVWGNETSDRMLAALENGVKGGKWFSLIDKISYFDHKRWPNAFFAGHGLFTMKEARVKVSQSR